MAGQILPFNTIVPTLGSEVFVAETAVVIGDVHIGNDSGIWYGCVVRGDVNEIRIGARTNIQDGTIIHVARDGQGTYLGDDITVGHRVLLHACTIGDGAFIGMGACVMDNVEIEPGGMVAAGALVTPGKRIKSGELWGKSPAVFMRNLSDAEQIANAANTAHYVKLKQTYLAGE